MTQASTLSARVPMPGTRSATTALKCPHTPSTEYGPPKDLRSYKFNAFNQLVSGIVGAIEVLLASTGTKPITGMSGKPTTQGTNEPSHQTLQRIFNANKSHDLTEQRRLIHPYRKRYKTRRLHHSLHRGTPEIARTILDHTSATEPNPLDILAVKVSEYLSQATIDAYRLAPRQHGGDQRRKGQQP